MNKYKDNTVLGIVTCNREDMLKVLVNSIEPKCFTKRYIINNGAPLSDVYDGYEVLQSNRNPTPVGLGKNKFFREVRKNNPEGYYFLLEDDVEIIDNTVWEKYIDTMHDSGIVWQLSYGCHGGEAGGNVDTYGDPKVKETVEYSTTKVDFYQESFAAFTLYSGKHFSTVGYMDETYVNAAEHLDHYYRAFLQGGVPWRYFPDMSESYKFIKDQDKDHQRSVIRNDTNFRQNFISGWQTFKSKYGMFPHELPVPTREYLMTRLEEIEQKFSSKHVA